MNLIELIREYGNVRRMEGWIEGTLDATHADDLQEQSEKMLKQERRKAERALQKIYKLLGVK